MCFQKRKFFFLYFGSETANPKKQKFLIYCGMELSSPKSKKKIYIKFSSSEFFSSESSLSESEEFSVSSIRMLEVCFSLTIYLHFPKNTWW